MAARVEVTAAGGWQRQDGSEEAQTSGSVGVSGSVGCGGIGSPC